jgi:hypothetical protein
MAEVPHLRHLREQIDALLGLGRWSSREMELVVPVGYHDIYHCRESEAHHPVWESCRFDCLRTEVMLGRPDWIR